MKLILIFSLLLGLTGCMHLEKSYEDAVINYEEYKEIYHTTQQLNTDLCQMRELPDKDPMFEQISKAQRINSLQSKLNRWVEDYNAKSKMINRNIWKGGDLPYQLTVNQFNCYRGDK